MKWLPQSLRTYNGEPVTADDAARADVRLALMRRHRSLLTAALLTIPPTILLLVLILWNRASRSGLLIFATLGVGILVVHWVCHLRLPIDKVPMHRLVIGQSYSGIAWASLTFTAMPQAQQWQAMVGAIMLAVLAAGLVFAAQFAAPLAAWGLTLPIFAMIGFLRVDTPIGNAIAALMGAAAIYAMLLGTVMRASDVGASAFAARNSDLIAELRDEKQHLRELAMTDPLTGIGNRLAFTQALDDALRSTPNSVAIAIVDLDDFKRVNDTLGHHAGDSVLKSIASRLAAALDENEQLYRLGGDELTVLQVRSPTAAPLDELGTKLLRVFDAPHIVAGRPLEVRASVGVAEAKRGADSEEIQRGADEALYRAKRSSDTEVEYFDAAMQIDARRMASLRESVTQALQDGHIVPWLQPVIELGTGAIIGAEALARWEHPEGVRSAGTFILAIEEAGMAPTLNTLIFEAVCEFQKRLDEVHGAEFFVSCNISPEYLRHFVERYEETGHLDGSIIEITEQRDLANHRQLARLIERAQAAGARVVVDDFGTGFSSMERLSLGSFDGLKIDGSFVQSLAGGRNNAAIVASIAEIGRHMNVPVVAEGIEAQHHADRLKAFGVRWGQGYLYSPAVPFDELLQTVREQRANGPHFAHMAATPITDLVAGTRQV